MRHLAIGTALSCLLIAVPAFAADPNTPSAAAAGSLFSADFGVSTAYEMWDGYEYTTGLYLGASGRVSVPLSDNFILQFDLAKHQAANNRAGADDNVYIGSSYLGGHALYRAPGAAQFGVFGRATSQEVDGVEAWSGYDYGLESQLYIENVTVWAQGGVTVLTEDTGSEEDFSGYFARGGLRTFTDTNMRIDADIGYADGALDLGWLDESLPVKTLSWGLGLETLATLGEVPAAFVLRYAGSLTAEATIDGGACVLPSYITHAITAGVNFKIGANDLLSMDRQGVNTDLDIGTPAISDAMYDNDCN